MAETNGNAQLFLSTRLNKVNPEAWSDVDDVQSIPSSPVDSNECENPSEQAVQEEIDHDFCLPPEVMENIVYYLDGRTLLKFKLLSKLCNVVTNNALRYNKLWKKICLNEIPKKYFMDLFNKHFNGKFVLFDSLSELQYERFYKNWLQWQNSIYNTICIGGHNLLGFGELNQIISHKFDVMVVFSKNLSEFSLIKNEAGKYEIIVKSLKPRKASIILTLNPHRHYINKKDEELNPYITLRQNHGNNFCPLHNDFKQIHDTDYTKRSMSKLIDVNTNIYVNACCWVRETYYKYHSDNILYTNVHLCNQLYGTMYTSVVHGVIIGYTCSNSIVIHNIQKDSCIQIKSWLNQKYTRASALYIHANILFIGSQNSYLLAYRLQCWDDLINLKNKNLILESKLDIGRIVKLDIIDFENVKILIVASESRILWINII